MDGVWMDGTGHVPLQSRIDRRAIGDCSSEIADVGAADATGKEIWGPLDLMMQRLEYLSGANSVCKKSATSFTTLDG
jgi:hypothetical protein